jgi:hypothetical protein
MNFRRRSFLALAGFVAAYLGYGAVRCALGVDFTDEGAYVAWPLRALFGERIFTGDPLLLLRPLFPTLAWLYRLWPEVSLLDLRLLGWAFHLAAFVTLANYLFRLSGAVLQSLLVASVPFFVCHSFGLAPPSYNSLSSDFLLIALSLRGLSRATNEGRGSRALEVGAGLALFVATFAHPGLGLVALALLVYEFWANDLGRNLVTRNFSPSNLGVLVFVAGWLALLLWFFGSGAFADWWHRLPLAQPRPRETLHDHPGQFFAVLFGYPFAFSRLALGFSALLVPTAAAAVAFARTGKLELAGRAAGALAVLLVASLIATFSYQPDFLPSCLVRAALLVVAVGWLSPSAAAGRGEDNPRFLLLLSALAATIYATLTYYFSPQRSWVSGTLGMPFAFAVGLTLLLRATPARLGAIRVLVPTALALLVGCAAFEHYRNLYRDAPPAELTATFQIPKFRGIHSTPERVAAVEALYAQLHPHLARGEPLLAFDDCPMLYFLFEARPAYGLTWAVRYTQSSTTLAHLNRELISRPLPPFAIRTLVDLSHPVWATAPRTNYENYPLNETVLARYTLARTIFPFEIWELKSPAPLEKASPGNPPP